MRSCDRAAVEAQAVPGLFRRRPHPERGRGTRNPRPVLDVDPVRGLSWLRVAAGDPEAAVVAEGAVMIGDLLAANVTDSGDLALLFAGDGHKQVAIAIRLTQTEVITDWQGSTVRLTGTQVGDMFMRDPAKQPALPPPDITVTRV